MGHGLRQNLLAVPAAGPHPPANRTDSAPGSRVLGWAGHLAQGDQQLLFLLESGAGRGHSGQ